MGVITFFFLILEGWVYIIKKSNERKIGLRSGKLRKVSVKIGSRIQKVLAF